MTRLKQDLAGPGIELIETHISWVFLSSTEVWKVKKPVLLGFLDFSTLEKRREACEAEVRLNGRLAPEVYLGVVAVTRDADGRHRIGGEGEPLDWAVHMRRLPDANRADVRLREGRLGDAHVERIASRLVSFHAQARCDDETARYGSLEMIAANVRENFEQTRERIQAHLAPAEAEEIESGQMQFLEEQADRFQARTKANRVRDGHGDLRLEHIYLDDDGGVTILDCIEFNERFRYADVCADLAFLSMDLAWHGRVDLAERVLAAYALESNDFDLFPLVDFYESYRAYVRGKVSSLLAADEGAELSARERASEEARRYYLLALAAERRPLLPPALVTLGGPVATGKSTIAARIAHELAAPVVSTDRTREFLLGLSTDQSLHEALWPQNYAPDFTDTIYTELFRRAAAVLASGRPVVLDGCFGSRAQRAAARELAAEHGVPFFFVECRVDPERCRERLRSRAREGGVQDEAWLVLAEDFLTRWEPVTELAESEHVILDTEHALDANAKTLKARIPTWPDGLTA